VPIEGMAQGARRALIRGQDGGAVRERFKHWNWERRGWGHTPFIRLD
jgi:hypothetical protein